MLNAEVEKGAQVMNVVKVEKFTLLPPAPGKCQACAVEHDAALPHNAQSLHYQYWFFGQHGRWPDWRDAMAHCSEEMKEHWRAALMEMGVDVDGGKVNPRKEEKS